MRDSGRPEPPSVLVLLSAYVAPDPPALREVLAGLEEEAVPAVVDVARARSEDQPDDCVSLAERAAERATLEVGVGIARDGLCLTHRALPDGAPLERLGAGPTPEQARRLGHDAARLVTGIPLKLVEGAPVRPPPGPCP